MSGEPEDDGPGDGDDASGPEEELSEFIPDAPGPDRTGDGSEDLRDRDDSEGDAGSTGDETPDADAPLGDLAASVDQRRDRAPSPAEDDLFDEEDVAEIDTEVVWERLEDDETPEIPTDADPEVRVVDKSEYCEQCPFFSAPPDVSCTHEGTEILELVDMEHFRVVDCPKVVENERLENL